MFPSSNAMQMFHTVQAWHNIHQGRNGGAQKHISKPKLSNETAYSLMDFIDVKCTRERAYLSLVVFAFKTHDMKLEMEKK